MRVSYWFVLWLSVAVAYGQSPVLVLTSSTDYINLWSQKGAEFYVDTSRYQSLEQVRPCPFRPTAGHTTSFGFTNASIWVRLRLRDETPAPTARIIGTTFNLIDTLDYYLINETTGSQIHQQSGRLIPHYRQQIDTHGRVFPLHLQPNQTYTVYFRVAGRNSKRLELRIEEANQYQANYQKSTWIWASYIGFYLTMILVQLIFYAITRNRNSLYYMLYLCAFLLVEVCRGNGMVGDRYLWPDATWFKSNSLLLSVPVATGFGMWFYANGLRLKQYSPLFYRVLQADALINLLLAGWALLRAAETNVILHVLLMALVSDLLVLGACFYVWKKGYPPARFYLLGTLCFFGGIITTLLWNLGLIPSHLAINQSLNIGCVLEMLFFTTALADEYRLTQREKQQAQSELIKVLQNQNQQITTALLRGQTLERQRMAADLHDNLGTTLSALHWNLEAMDKTKLSAVEQAVYATINQQVSQAYNDVRLLSHNLLPDELAKQGLAVALRGLVEKMNRNTPVRFRLSGADTLPRLDGQMEFELYSICLELLNNTIKHAHASEGFIDLTQANGMLYMTVGDNGTGLNGQRTDGRGLHNVAARVNSLAGTLTVDSVPGGGVQNRIAVPVRMPVRLS